MTTIAASGQRGEGVIGRLRSKLGLGHYALFTAFATYGLIVLGGTVRATNSGEACPDWPLCHGEIIPPLPTPTSGSSSRTGSSPRSSGS